MTHLSFSSLDPARKRLGVLPAEAARCRAMLSVEQGLAVRMRSHDAEACLVRHPLRGHITAPRAILCAVRRTYLCGRSDS